MIIKNSGLIIQDYHPEYNSIKKDLTRKLYGFNGEPSIVKFYEEQENSILVPRYYPVMDKIKDESNLGEDIEIEGSIVPRNERQKKAIDLFCNNNSGVLKLEPGSGKTVIAIAAICKIKKKTIIFIHKGSLKKQWVEEILKFTNLTEDDIGTLSSKTFEEDLKKPIILSTVQAFCYSLIHKDDFYKKVTDANIGVSFFDETHTTVGPERFSMTSLHLSCARTYGLSATPTRADGCEDIIFKHLGELTYFEPEKDELLKPKVFMVCFPFEIYKNHAKYIMWGGHFNPGKYCQQMYKEEHYISMVCKFINKLYKLNRNILVLGVRKNALLELASQSKLPKTEMGIFIPSATKKEKLECSDTTNLTEAFNEKRVVFSTYGAARDGNNRKNLDTLIMTYPTGVVEQAAGRILRPLDGKKLPYVIDLVDLEGPRFQSKDDPYKSDGFFVRGAKKRLEFYRSKGWDVEISNIK